jgi:hypothetical protein
MGPKGEPDTKTNWSTDCRPQDDLQFQLQLYFQHLSVERSVYLYVIFVHFRKLSSVPNTPGMKTALACLRKF